MMTQGGSPRLIALTSRLSERFVGRKPRCTREKSRDEGKGKALGSLILRSLRMRKVQTASIIASVALSAALILAFGLVYGGVTKGIELSDERGGADIMVVPADAEKYLTGADLLFTGAPVSMYMTEDEVRAVSDIEGVTRVTGQFFSQTLDQSCCSATSPTRLIGVDFTTDFVVTPLLDEGFAGELGANEVVVGSRVDGISQGQISILGKPYNVVSTMAESGGELDESIVMDIDTAREISRNTDGNERYWDMYGDPSELVSCIMVEIDDEQLTRVETKLNLMRELSYVEHSETAERAQAQLKAVFVLLAGSAVLMLVVTLLQIFARFYSCVWDRKSELALYRAIGASKSDIRKLIGGEVCCLVVIGLVVGLALGAVAYESLISLLLDTLAFPFVGLGAPAVAVICLGIIALFAFVSFLSVVWPLRQVGRLDPSLAMQQGDID